MPTSQAGSQRKMAQFSIEIVSDTTCPWCYIGKKKLEQAISQYRERYPEAEEESFSMKWTPYFLYPNAPKIGTDRVALYESKIGPDLVNQIIERAHTAGKAVGIPFIFGGKTGHTRDSQRLLLFARGKSAAMQKRVVEELFQEYFEKQGDITSLNMLCAAAARAGMDEQEVREWLESDSGVKQVDDEVATAKAQGILGVPTFIVNDRYELGGAQEPDVFLALFEKIRCTEGVEEKIRSTDSA